MKSLKKQKEIIFLFLSLPFFVFSLSLNVSAQITNDVVRENPEDVISVEFCRPLVSEKLGYGRDNDQVQVRLLQAFLVGIENHDLEVTGIFDNDTLEAVHSFQRKYADDILAPWGLSAEESTGFVSITTKNKINEVFCGREIQLTVFQKAEIASFTGSNVDLGTVSGSNTVELNLTDTTGNSETDVDDREKEVAVAAFVFPQTPREGIFYALWLVLILALIYILGSLIAGIKGSKGLNQNQIRTRKITYFMVGTLIGLVVAVALKLTAIVAPLIVIIIALSLGLIYYARKTS